MDSLEVASKLVASTQPRNDVVGAVSRVSSVLLLGDDTGDTANPWRVNKSVLLSIAKDLQQVLFPTKRYAGDLSGGYL